MGVYLTKFSHTRDLGPSCWQNPRIAVKRSARSCRPLVEGCAAIDMHSGKPRMHSMPCARAAGSSAALRAHPLADIGSPESLAARYRVRQGARSAEGAIAKAADPVHESVTGSRGSLT
jgi:hypothetical protein